MGLMGLMGPMGRMSSISRISPIRRTTDDLDSHDSNGRRRREVAADDGRPARDLSERIRDAGLARWRQHRLLAYFDARRALSHLHRFWGDDGDGPALEPRAARNDRDNGLGREPVFLLSGIARRVSAYGDIG